MKDEGREGGRDVIMSIVLSLGIMIKWSFIKVKRDVFFNLFLSRLIQEIKNLIETFIINCYP